MFIKNIHLITYFAINSFYCCAQKHKVDINAVKLNKQAIALLQFNNNDSSEKAASLLDSATAIDSNYFYGYQNKLVFLLRLKEYNKAIITVNNLIRIKPFAPDLYVTCGMIYEKNTDSISSKKYFENALILYNNILDTMNTRNKYYDALLVNKAIDLIMLDKQKAGEELIKKVCDKQTDKMLKKYYQSYMYKDKKELIIFSNEINEASSDSSVHAIPVN